MPRKKSTDTPEVKALRKLLKSLGLTVPAVNALLAQAEGRYADLSAKACEIEMYIAAHPEVGDPAAYAAVTLRNFAAAPPPAARAMAQKKPELPATMELWGDDE